MLNYYFIEETNSTNLLINEIVENNTICKEPLPDFFCVVTNYQTAGKGQGKKQWMSK